MSFDSKSCACCPSTERPEGYYEEPIETLRPDELIWSDDKHLSLQQPSTIKYLDRDLGNDPAVVKQLATNYGCCSSFRVLSTEGSKVLDHVLNGIDKHAKSSARIPRLIRGGTLRSQFLNGMGHSPAVLRHVSALAGCEMIYHPMKIHQLHINLKPQDTSDGSTRQAPKKNVDRWHCDSTPFVLIVFCTDPDEYTGGELQYFSGPREEGMALLSSGNGLPADRVLNVGRQMKGFGVFMQGWRVFHQVTPVLSGPARTTIVYSFYPRNVLALEACTHLSQTYAPVDPVHVIMPDWVRFRAWKVLRRLEIMQEEHFPRQQAAKRDGLKPSDPNVEELLAAVDSSYEKLVSIVRTLPYTADRKLFVDLLSAAVAPLKGHLVRAYPDLVVYESYGTECARSHSQDEFKPSWTSVADMHSPASGTEADCLIAREGTRSPPHSEGFLSSPTGLPNLLAAVEDVENCIQDVQTLQEHESKLVYF